MKKWFQIIFLFLIALVVGIWLGQKSTSLNNKNEENPKPKIQISDEDIQSKVINTTQQTIEDVYSVIITKNLRYLVEDPFWIYPPIVTEHSTQIWEGSALYLQDGYFLTNKHVVKDLKADYTLIDAQNNKFKVDGIWFDPILDLAIIHVKDIQKNSNLNKIIPSRYQIPIWTFVIAIGNALGEYQNTVSFGIVSNKGRALKEQANDSIYIGLYQTDAAINPGNSGWPLVEVNSGYIIGINTAISNYGQGIGFAIPINQEMIKAMLQSIKQYWKIVHPFLGVSYISTPQGYKIISVKPWSVAQQYDLPTEGIITHINGQKVDSSYPLTYYLYQFLPGQEIEFSIKEKNKIRNMLIILK